MNFFIKFIGFKKYISNTLWVSLYMHADYLISQKEYRKIEFLF